MRSTGEEGVDDATGRRRRAADKVLRDILWDDSLNLGLPAVSVQGDVDTRAAAAMIDRLAAVRSTRYATPNSMRREALCGWKAARFDS